MKHKNIFWLGLLGCAAFVAQALGVTDGNPYQSIVGRNSFALKPPTPQTTTAPPVPTLPTKILLQGITTILDQKQVFLKIQPPPPGKEISAVLGEGQREGDVEVLEIRNLEGLVKINLGGTPQTLSMENDAAKPTGVAPIPGAVPNASPQAGTPGIPVPAVRPTISPSVTTMGGSKTLPARSMRSQAGAAGRGAGIGQASPQNLPTPSLEEQTIMMEVQREITAREVEAGTMPPLPPTEFSPPTPPRP